MACQLNLLSRNNNLLMFKCSSNQIWGCSTAIPEDYFKNLDDRIHFELCHNLKFQNFLCKASMVESICNRLGSGNGENYVKNSL